MCSVDPTHGVATRRGMCNNCYRKYMRGTLGNTPTKIPPLSFDLINQLSERDEDGCLIWKGGRLDKDGRPRWFSQEKYTEGSKNPLVYVHRWVYEQVNGPIPKGRHVRQTCGKKLCVSPDCLTSPGDKKGRPTKGEEGQQGIRPQKTTCKNGHDLTDPNNLYIHPRSGRRSCRECAWASRMRSRGIDPRTRTRKPHNRDLTKCSKGHPFEPGSYYTTADGNRVCKKCRAVASKKRGLKKLYGITLEEFEAMLTEQDGRCKICLEPVGSLVIESNYRSRDPDKWKRAMVDHCHRTGKVRGILCMGCNFSIGHFKDDPEILRRAAAYLEERL